MESVIDTSGKIFSVEENHLLIAEGIPGLIIFKDFTQPVSSIDYESVAIYFQDIIMATYFNGGITDASFEDY